MSKGSRKVIQYLWCKIKILKFLLKVGVFGDLKGTTENPFVYAMFPNDDVHMEVAMCIKLIELTYQVSAPPS